MFNYKTTIPTVPKFKINFYQVWLRNGFVKSSLE